MIFLDETAALPEDFPEISATCRECGAEGFEEVSITVKTKNGEYSMWICQSCGHKFVFSEAGSIGCVRFIKSEPPECSVKPKQLTGGKT